MLSDVPEGWSEPAPLSIYASNETRKWDEVEVLPYVGLEHIEQGTGQLLGFGESQSVTSAKNLFEPGDVLFGKLRPNLRKYWKADRRGICSTDILVLKSKQGLESNYLFAVVQSEPFLAFAENDAAGTKMPRTSWKRLETIELPIPPLNEQHRIAEILSSVDASIQATQAVIEQAERVKRGLMEELLTGGLGSEAIERGEVTEGWNVKALSDVAVVKGGKRMPKGAKFSEKPTAYPYIRVSDFANGSISTKDIQYVSPEHQAQIARYTISKEDIYISIAGTLGVVGTVPDELDGAQLTENAAKISIQSASMIDREFLARVLQSSVGQSQIGIKKGVGGGVPKLALFRIGEINLPIPPLQEQKRISEVLSSIDDFIAAQNSIVEQNQRTKRGLMDDLLTGKVRTV